MSSAGEKAERRLFGTDGVRGRANEEPVTAEMALALGRAVAHVFRSRSSHCRIVIGADTRRSGDMLEAALAAGICSMGAEALVVGVIPTPAIAFLTRNLRADAGAVISASHNPFEDNGIKFFARNGFKLPDELELQIERLVLENGLPAARPTGAGVGKVVRIDDAVGRYNVFAKAAFPRHASLEGMRIAVDCANGAAYRVAPQVLAEMGAGVFPLGVDPDGTNINAGCGALHPDGLRAAVREHGAHVGVALDGDADRSLFVDETGDLVDGDEIMAMLAVDMHRRGALKGATVVSTVMSNLGLEVALAGHGIELRRTAVGDRYVVDEMVRGDFNLGGEQSGHIIQLDHSTTGDGLVTALAVLRLLVESQQPLSVLRKVMTRFPQILRNIRVAQRIALAEVPGLGAVIERWQETLGSRGRVFVRYSGTEPLLRIMVEGESAETIRNAAEEIAAAALQHLG